MARYDITYSCGHEGEVRLFGKSADRERKIEWMESTLVCPDCLREKADK